MMPSSGSSPSQSWSSSFGDVLALVILKIWSGEVELGKHGHPQELSATWYASLTGSIWESSLLICLATIIKRFAFAPQNSRSDCHSACRRMKHCNFLCLRDGNQVTPAPLKPQHQHYPINLVPTLFCCIVSAHSKVLQNLPFFFLSS